MESGEASLRFLRWAQQDFASEGLRCLRHDHGYGMGYVRGLQHLLGIFSWMRAELRVNGAWANYRDTNVVGAQFLGYGVGQSIQAPLGGGVGGSVGQCVLAGQGRDVDDVSAAGFGIDHQRREAAD